MVVNSRDEAIGMDKFIAMENVIDKCTSIMAKILLQEYLDHEAITGNRVRPSIESSPVGMRGSLV